MSLSSPAGLRHSPRVPLIALLCLPLAGCAGQFQNWWNNGFKVGPDYCRPAAQVAENWIDVDDPRVVSEYADHSYWWTTFNDPILDQLVQTAYQQNLSLRVAAYRVLEARAKLGIARGNLLPQQQQAFGDYQRIQISRQTNQIKQSDRLNSAIGGILPPGISAPGVARAFDFFDLGFDAAWELDIWGRFRRAVEAADASFDATIEDYDAVLVTLVSDVAATYVEIRTVQQALAYQRRNVEIQTGSRQLAKVRFDGGVTTELDVTQADTSLANTKSLIPALEAALRQSENRLCVLLGMPPRDIQDLMGGVQPTEDDSVIPTAPPEVVVGIPADLLRRRPDVRAAERRVAAQSASIGVAAADLFPSFTILGSIQLEAENFSDLFTGKSVAGFLGAPGIRWNILNYGRIRNNIDVQDARFEQLAFQYEQAVLQANQEVEDALVSFLKSQQQFRQDTIAVNAAKRSVEIALTQYRDGATDFNRVFTLQSILANQQLTLAQTQGDIAQSLIGVYKALGGGWQIRLNPQGAMEIIQAPIPEEAPLPMPEDGAPMPPADPVPPAVEDQALGLQRQPEVVPVGHWELMHLKPLPAAQD